MYQHTKAFGNVLKHGMSDYFGIAPSAPKLDPESYEQIYPRLEPYNDPSAAPDMNVNFGGLKFAPSYQNINVPELLENVPEYLALVEGPEDETRRPRPRGRYDGGRSQKRTEQRQKTLLYQRHPEKLEELADEAMKNQYKLFLQEREARLKWLSTVITMKQSFFTSLLIFLMLVLYVWEIIYNRQFNFSLTNPWLWGSVTPNTLLDCGGKYAQSIIQGEWWRLITAMFLHVSLPHILLNVLALHKVGPQLEKTLGARRIVPVVLISGIGGNLLSAIFVPEKVTGGASVAVFALHGVVIVDLVKNWSNVIKPARELLSIIFIVVILVAAGFLPGADNFTHLGGLVFGIIAGNLFVPSRDVINQARNSPDAPKTTKSRVCVIITMLVLLLTLLVIMFVVLYTVVPYRNWCPFCERITCIRELFGDWCGRDAFSNE